jgi:phenylacetate-CoA ligase
VRGWRLRALALHACKAPYYREAFRRAGLQVEDFGSESALQQLPFLTKAILQEVEVEAFRGVAGRPLFQVITSGSTGEPHRIYRSDRDQAEISATWDRLFGVFGRRLWDRQVNIGSGRPIAKQGPAAFLRRAGVLPRLYQLSSFDPIEAQIALLRRVRPHMISAYAVALEDLAEAVLAAPIDDIRPRVVYTSAMGLSDRCRSLCRKAFGVTPLDVYATVELGPVGWECPHNPGVLHVNDDVQILEIVDDHGQAVPPGELGEVVITQLTCFAQPLIRYRIGDLGYRIQQRCCCGRGLGLMGPIAGRTKHTIRTSDGRVLNSAVVGSCISPFPEVRRWQARQIAANALRVLVVPTGEWGAESRDAIRRSLVARLGVALEVEVVVVEEIPLAPNGKAQTIVPLGEPAPAISPAPGSGWQSPSATVDFS